MAQGLAKSRDNAFYTTSTDRYELPILPNGQFFGVPEETLRVLAGVYLSG